MRHWCILCQEARRREIRPFTYGRNNVRVSPVKMSTAKRGVVRSQARTYFGFMIEGHQKWHIKKRPLWHSCDAKQLKTKAKRLVLPDEAYTCLMCLEIRNIGDEHSIFEFFRSECRKAWSAGAICLLFFFFALKLRRILLRTFLAHYNLQSK